MQEFERGETSLEILLDWYIMNGVGTAQLCERVCRLCNTYIDAGCYAVVTSYNEL